jgi:hypothetical protein
MATILTKQNYTVDNVPLGLIEHLPVNVRQHNDLVSEFNTGGSFSSFTTQAIAANNTAINADLGAASYSNGITLAANAKSVTVEKAGTYSFDAAMQYFKNNTTAEGTMTAWYAVNGTAFANAVDGSANSESLAITNQLVVLNVHAHLTLNAGDTVALMFAGNTAGTVAHLQFRASAASTPYPAIASISLEVDKIR